MLHAAVVALFLLRPPERTVEAPVEQAVAVEIVPEPREPEPEKPEPPPKAPEPVKAEKTARQTPPAVSEPPPEPASKPASPPPPSGAVPPAVGEETAVPAPEPERAAPPQPFEASSQEKSEAPPDPADMPFPEGKAGQTDDTATAESVGNLPERSSDAPQPTASEPSATTDAPVEQAEPAETATSSPTVASSKTDAASEPVQATPALPEILAERSPSGKGEDSGVSTSPPDPAKPAPNSANAPVGPPGEAGRPPQNIASSVPSSASNDESPMAPSEQAAYVPATPAVPQAKPTPSPAPKPARTLYAKDILTDPRVRGALSKLPTEKRIVQICGIEALEQARHAGAGFTPELLKGFGKNGGLISGTHLSARGGAVRSRGVWREISFDCTVNANFDAITSFRFALGANIPRRLWAAEGLATD